MPGFLAALIYLGGAPLTPVATATGDIVSYILGYGVLGIVTIAFGTKFIIPWKLAEKMVSDARTDLVSENRRLLEEKTKAEEQRDEAVKIAQEKLIPMLTSFVATTQSLIPLLQDVVREREEWARGRYRS